MLLGATYIYRNKIIELFVNEANKYISTKIFVDKIDLNFWETFPYFSLEFQNIRITESFANSTENFAEVKKLYVSLSVKDIINKKIKVKQIMLNDGVLNFKINELGDNNFTIFKSDDDTTVSSAIVFELSNIQLKNIRLIYNDQETQNDYDIFANQAKAKFIYNNYNWDIALQADVISNELKFNKLSFFKNTPMLISSTLKYTENDENYVINPTEIKVLDAIFNLEGNVSFEKRPFADLKFSEKNSGIKTILSLIPDKFGKALAKYETDGKVYFRGVVQGYFDRGNKPLVKINFGCSNTQIKHPELGVAIKNMGFVGEYCNGMRNKYDSSYFKLDNIKAKLSGNDLVGNLALVNLKNPQLRFKLNSKVDAKFLNNYYHDSPFQNVDGLVDFDINFTGNLNEIERKDYKSVNSSGFINLENIQFNLAAKKYTFTEINTKVFFNKTDIEISKFNGKIGKTDFALEGKLQNIIPYFAHPNQSLYLQAKLKSKQLFLDELLIDIDSSGNENTKINLDSKISLDLKTQIDEFRFKKIFAKNITSDVLYKNKKILIDNTNLDIANGKIKLKSFVEQTQDSNLIVNSNIIYDKVQIDSIFYFNDQFGQKFITHNNIKGQLSSQVNLSFLMNNKGNIDKKSLKADINMSITNGHLIKLDVLQKMSKFVNEDALADIKFLELKNDFKVYDEKIIIPEMTLKSNITTMKIYGTHGFDNQFEYHIKLPLRNYKKKENLEESKAIENDGKGGLNIYLKIYGTPDNFKVVYDAKAVKEHIIERLKEIKDDFKQIFDKDYLKNKIEKEKAIELKNDEFLELD